MDGILFVTLLLTGFCTSFASEQDYSYIFINEAMTWDDAQKYCTQHHIELAQTDSYKLLNMTANTQIEVDAHKAWIGLLKGDHQWTWIDGSNFTTIELEDALRNADNDERCAAIEDTRFKVLKCSQERDLLCQDSKGHIGTSNHKLRMTWTDAWSFCRRRNLTLLTISDKDKLEEVDKLNVDDEMWLGLRKTRVWVWSHNGGTVPEMEEPLEDIDQVNLCGAILLDTGTMAAEGCSKKYPFFCYNVAVPEVVKEKQPFSKVKKTVVKLQLKSDANLEDPVWRAELLQQLRSSFANHNLGDVKLTWKKVPEKKVKHESPCD